MLDTEGRLVSLRSVPSHLQAKAEAVTPSDWNLLFVDAGLDISKWKQTEGQWIPDSYADSRAVWEGSLPNFPEAPARIEAASFQRKAGQFRSHGSMVTVGCRYNRQQPLNVLAAFGLVTVARACSRGGIFFARRNLRLGRGDRRNANRLALFVLIIFALSAGLLRWPQVSFVNLLLFPYLAALIWIFYMAIEPFVRRRWPQVLVSWTRLLSGEWRDPLVARDILIGCAFGVFVASVWSYMLTTSSIAILGRTRRASITSHITNLYGISLHCLGPFGKFFEFAILGLGNILFA